MRALATLAGRNCQAYHVNEVGQAVGLCQNAAGQLRAVLWSPSGQVRSLGTLPGGRSSVATDVNDNGVVVGYSTVRLSDGTLGSHPFRWTAAGGMRDLWPDLGLSVCGTLETADARRVNRSGQVVGTLNRDVECGGTHTFAFRLSPGIGVDRAEEFASGAGIDDLGEIVGAIAVEDLLFAFRERSPGQPVGLPDLCDASDRECHSLASAINSAGLVVGSSMTADHAH
jgi:probable HAF family extracellular repeat protein